MPTPSTRELATLMNVTAAEVQSSIRAGHRAGLSRDAAALAAMIAVLSAIRVDGLNEAALLKEAQRAVPTAGGVSVLGPGREGIQG